MRLVSQRRICLIFILCFALGALFGYRPAIGEDSRASLPGDVSQKDTGQFGKLANKFVIMVGELPIFHSSEQIDRVVGDPWTLSPTTAAKLGLLPPQIRLRLYSAIAERVSTMQLDHAPATATNQAQDIDPVVLTVSSKDAEQIVTSFVRSLPGYFTVDELVDLGVYLVATKTPFFPKGQAGWDKIKTGIANNAILIAIAALAGELATNQGNIGLSGWFLKLENDSLRLGWYGAASSFGIGLKPSFKLGAALTTNGFELLAGLNEKVNPTAKEEKRSFEIQLREHWLAALGKKRGWDVSASARIKYVLEYGNPAEKQDVVSSLDFFARKNKIFDDPLLAFLINAALSSDFYQKASASVSLGFEDEALDLIVALKGSYSFDDSPSSGNRQADYALGFYASGKLGRKTFTARNEMDSSCQRVLETLVVFHSAQPTQSRLLEKLKPIGTLPDRQEQDSALVLELKETEGHIFEIQKQLASDLKDYQKARSAYYQSKGVSPESLSVTDGPLSSADFLEVLAALDFSDATDMDVKMSP